MVSLVTMTTCCMLVLSLSTYGYHSAPTDEQLLKEIDGILRTLTERHEKVESMDSISVIEGDDTTDKRGSRISGKPNYNKGKRTDNGDGDVTVVMNQRGKYSEQCAEGFVACGGAPGGQCIRVEYLCDGFDDCYADGWDEDPNNCGAVHCSYGQIKCNGTGRCISRHDMCNDRDDCGDREDENTANCGIKRCDHRSTKCPGVNMCLRNDYWCDGDNDCPGGEDEIVDSCQHVPCDGVRCTDGRCISSDKYCDGFPDCFDGGDEDIKYCGPVKCSGSSVKCGGANYCYRKPRWRTCDGHNDCPNGFDERKENCQIEEPVAGNWYSYKYRKPNRTNKKEDLESLLNKILKRQEQRH